ncbi:hypothetical protein J0S82_003167 [Galemys pyrenaicus]|uniref:Uncharacterized protein n=1 Tax=Galemys pyrenaicus TaxID=202257 RepID=A0A8J6A7A7_GALPY|nr:hypothetical protein J0S82_003167 [Galemys pyrenaicus]
MLLGSFTLQRCHIRKVSEFSELLQKLAIDLFLAADFPSNVAVLPITPLYYDILLSEGEEDKESDISCARSSSECSSSNSNHSRIYQDSFRILVRGQPQVQEHLATDLILKATKAEVSDQCPTNHCSQCLCTRACAPTCVTGDGGRGVLAQLLPQGPQENLSEQRFRLQYVVLSTIRVTPEKELSPAHVGFGRGRPLPRVSSAPDAGITGRARHIAPGAARLGVKSSQRRVRRPCPPPAAADASAASAVLRDPTLPCAKDTSGGSAGPFYTTAPPL